MDNNVKALPRMKLFGRTIARALGENPEGRRSGHNLLSHQLYIIPEEERQQPFADPDCDHQFVRDSFVKHALRCTRCGMTRSNT